MGWSAEPTQRELLTLLLFFALLKFLVVLFLLKWRPLRMLLTPGSTKTRRVRRRAIMLFKTGGERRTIGRTGILIYLSMAEHRAEIVADEAITKVTTPGHLGRGDDGAADRGEGGQAGRRHRRRGGDHRRGAGRAFPQEQRRTPTKSPTS